MISDTTARSSLGSLASLAGDRWVAVLASCDACVCMMLLVAATSRIAGDRWRSLLLASHGEPFGELRRWWRSLLVAIAGAGWRRWWFVGCCRIGLKRDSFERWPWKSNMLTKRRKTFNHRGKKKSNKINFLQRR